VALDEHRWIGEHVQGAPPWWERRHPADTVSLRDSRDHTRGRADLIRKWQTSRWMPSVHLLRAGMFVALEHRLHIGDGLLAGLGIPDLREFPFQVRGEVSIAVLPIPADHILKLGISRFGPCRRRRWRKTIDFADLGHEDGGSDLLRLRHAPQRLDRGRFPVRQEQATANRPASFHPREETVLVGMRRVAFDMPDLRPHDDILAPDTHPFRAFEDDPAQRSFSLEADEQYGRFPLEKVVLEVMPDTPRLAHAGRRHDDRPRDAVQPDGFRGRVDEMKGRVPEDVLASHVFERICIFGEHARRSIGERGVHENGHRSDAFRIKQRGHVEQELLRPLEREYRDNQVPAARQRTLDLGLEQGATITDSQIVALAVSISGFADDVVKPGRAFRIGMKGLVLGSQVT